MALWSLWNPAFCNNSSYPCLLCTCFTISLTQSSEIAIYYIISPPESVVFLLVFVLQVPRLRTNVLGTLPYSILYMWLSHFSFLTFTLPTKSNPSQFKDLSASYWFKLYSYFPLLLVHKLSSNILCSQTFNFLS